MIWTTVDTHEVVNPAEAITHDRNKTLEFMFEVIRPQGRHFVLIIVSYISAPSIKWPYKMEHRPQFNCQTAETDGGLPKMTAGTKDFDLSANVGVGFFTWEGADVKGLVEEIEEGLEDDDDILTLIASI